MSKMSREHLSITSLTCTTDSPLYKPPPKPSLHSASNDGYGGSPSIKSFDSPTSSSSAASCLSPTHYEVQMSRYPNSMYTLDSVRKDLNRQASPADPNSSSGSSYGNQSGYSLSHEPMSLDERRKRNKAASAKYRAKKQSQISQMSSEISLLTEVNVDLQKRLQQVYDDNERLRAQLMVLQSQSDHPANDKEMKRSRDSDHMPIY
ncbi:hypothetical protein K450DRAFT_238198 [Umbelopsis ramanniana AG]|uniref:BZIP domain-containing protein n=1 Tax=Umbelopsis ramanniana AG TaxID=1314678 RepID=A0AAD5EBF3_UMBRA|nr:uncharacterized protein K450DRAFT_238198 [Umbelopsis ramanniana AG]KAI8580374.1 hypothetical protein K450DRAFT_238198 [Umbelopsis ramanniana AG]